MPGRVGGEAEEAWDANEVSGVMVMVGVGKSTGNPRVAAAQPVPLGCWLAVKDP